MPQVVYRLTDHKDCEKLVLPPATEAVYGRVRWGRFSQPYTPAFWCASLWLVEQNAVRPVSRSRSRILKETIFCVLGGYGIKTEVAQAYFQKLRAAGIFDGRLTFSEIRRILSTPAHWRGHTYGYRFPNQKARYLASVLEAFVDASLPTDDLILRDWLLELPGIGYKTAAWIVRNALGSDNVAIIDIHLQRAGRIMGIFDGRKLSAATYSYFENRFLEFARALSVSASALDMLIWETMRQNLVSPRKLLA